MQKPWPFLITFALGLLIHSTWAQVNEFHFYSDTSEGSLSRLYDYHKLKEGVVLAGSKEISGQKTALIIKLDTMGEVVWSTEHQNLTPVACSNFKFRVFNDGFLYGVSQNYISPAHHSTLWKIDIQNGQVIWQKGFYTTTSGIINLASYDSTSFVAVYSTNDDDIIARVNKVNGDTLETYLVGSSTNRLAVKTDHNKNIYFSRRNKLFKFNQHDFGQVIWQHKYTTGGNPLDEIHEVYLDRFDNIFLFGRDGGSFGYGKGIIKKISGDDGSEEWTASLAFPKTRIADFIDQNNKLYATYRHTLTGSGSYKFRTARIDKHTGAVDWAESHNVTPLGQPGTNGTQAGLSLDADCYGNVYVTGYYGGSNYGPEAWGVMKLAAKDGSKLYDLTITQDSANYDDLSSGMAVCVIDNHPIILGNLEYATGKVKALWVKLNGANGDVVQRKFIGSSLRNHSRTRAIKRMAGSTYVLKQHGAYIVTEKYINDSLQWQHVMSDAEMLKAGQLDISTNGIFVSYHKPEADNLPPYHTTNSVEMGVYQLSPTNGSLLGSGTISTAPFAYYPIEIEASGSDAYLFSIEADSLFYRKWNSNIGFSAKRGLQEKNRTSNFHGNLNQVIDYNSNALLIAGEFGLYTIDKSNLQLSQLVSFSQPMYYYSLYKSTDTLLMSGEDSSGQPVASAVDLNSNSIIWSNSYGSQGAFYHITADQYRNLYAAGEDDMQMFVQKLKMSNGNLIWQFYQDSTQYPASSLYNMTINSGKKCLALGGSVLQPDGSSDALFTIIDYKGDTLLNYYQEDQLGQMSMVYSSGVNSDSSFWFGGSLNLQTESFAGYIFSAKATGNHPNIKMKEWQMSKIAVYPNPTKGELYLQGLNNGNFTFSIQDISGRVILAPTKASNRKILLPSITDGIYFLRIEQEGNFFTGKVLLRRGD